MADGNALNKAEADGNRLGGGAPDLEMQRYRILIEAMQDGLIETDTSGTIQFCNPGMTGIFGHSEEELVGRGLVSTLIFPPDQQFFHETIANCCNGDYPQIEIRGITRTGRVKWLKAGLAPITDPAGKASGMVIILNDITRQKANERELIAAREKAEESNRLKAHFLANLSHEIRTPMNGIMGFLQLLGELNLSRSEQEGYIRIIQRSGERLLETINDIVEMAMIETGQQVVNLSRFSVQGVLHQIESTFRGDCREKNLTLDISLPAGVETTEIVTDEKKVVIILSCLMKNAIRFTGEGGIELGYRLEGQRIVFFVKDTGIGIASDRIPSVFDRFVHGDMNTSRPHEGSGLGLSIARGYSGMLGGSLHVETKEGSGSTFYLALPVDITKQTQPPSGVVRSLVWTPVRGATILVAEEDYASYLFLEALLKREGAVVIHAKSGRETLEQLRHHPGTDLILLDVMLRDMNGYETVRAIRKINQNIPVIVQTAYAVRGDRELALEAGCTDFITKPVSKEVLIGVISKYIRKEIT